MKRTSRFAVMFAALAVAAVPVATAEAADTTVTLTLASGSLSISAPASASLSGVTSGSAQSLTGSIGSTTVTDTRGAIAGLFDVSMSVTDFSDGAGHTIPKSGVTGYSGLATTGGVIVAVPTLVGQSVGGAGGAVILSATGILGSVSATYNPTLAVSVPAATPAGVYTAVVTQTAS